MALQKLIFMAENGLPTIYTPVVLRGATGPITAAAGSIAAGGQSGKIQTRFSKTDWSNYIQTGDYSFDPTTTAFADWTRVTLYRNRFLVGGTEL